jgi:hypothetical protein
MLMGIFMKVCGKMIWHMVMENIPMLTAQSMMVNGFKTNNMALV